MSTDAVTHSPAAATLTRRVVFVVLRLVVAGGIVAALGVTFAGSTADWNAAGYPDRATLVTNFWSYFTVDSNAGSVLVLLIGAALLIRRRVSDPAWFTVLRASFVAYMTVTGVVYNLLLRNVPVSGAAQDAFPWTNEVLHVIAPIYIVLDWLLAPGRRPIEWRRLAIILAFPLVWVVYSLVRGPLVYDQVRVRDSWYPYPFLDPTVSANGYLSVAFYVIMITVLFGVVGSLIVWSSRRGGPRADSGILAE